MFKDFIQTASEHGILAVFLGGILVAFGVGLWAIIKFAGKEIHFWASKIYDNLANSNEERGEREERLVQYLEQQSQTCVNHGRAFVQLTNEFSTQSRTLSDWARVELLKLPSYELPTEDRQALVGILNAVIERHDS